MQVNIYYQQVSSYVKQLCLIPQLWHTRGKRKPCLLFNNLSLFSRIIRHACSCKQVSQCQFLKTVTDTYSTNALEKGIQVLTIVPEIGTHFKINQQQMWEQWPPCEETCHSNSSEDEEKCHYTLWKHCLNEHSLTKNTQILHTAQHQVQPPHTMWISSFLSITETEYLHIIV